MNRGVFAVSFVLGYWGVPLVVLVSLVFRQWATDRNVGAGPCVVCDEAFVSRPGEHCRLTVWLRTRRHEWVIARKRWHRDALAAWNRSAWLS